MRITAIVVHPWACRPNVRWTAQEIPRRVALTLVEVRTDAGIVGIGEISSGPRPAVCRLLAGMAPLIKGMDGTASRCATSSIAESYAGFSEALRIARHARQKGVRVAPHSAAHIQAHMLSVFGEATLGAEAAGDHRKHPIHHRIFRGGAEHRGGRVHVSKAAGIGFEVDGRR